MTNHILKNQLYDVAFIPPLAWLIQRRYPYQSLFNRWYAPAQPLSTSPYKDRF